MSYFKSIPTPPPLPAVVVANPKPMSKESSNDLKLEEKELHSAIERLLCTDEKSSRIFHLTNTYTKPQLQVGPKCGLVALSIATSVGKNFVSVNDIYEKALAQGFTRQGEIFNVTFLAELARKCGFKTKIIKGGLDSHLNCIVQNILNKGLLLVPYDSDHNHSPCCKQGLKAHWAIISGVAIFTSFKKPFEMVNDGSRIHTRDENNDDDNDIVSVKFGKSTVLCHCSDGESNIDNGLTFFMHEGKIVLTKNTSMGRRSIDNNREGKVYLIGRQGKSKHISLWSFYEMSESNNNLLFFASDRNSEFYVLPDGGPAEGLKGKAIILHL